MGLGLALCKRLVELHGGTITADRAGEGKGSEFCIYLPVDDGKQDATSPKPAALPAENLARKILIVEDNTDAADTLCKVLELNGHTVAVALHGRQGLELAQEFKPDVIVCDIDLPGMDGYEFARQVRKDKKLAGIHLIALSEYASPDDVRRAMDAGFDYHLAKPMGKEKMDELLAGWASEAKNV